MDINHVGDQTGRKQIVIDIMFNLFMYTHIHTYRGIAIMSFIPRHQHGTEQNNGT